MEKLPRNQVEHDHGGENLAQRIDEDDAGTLPDPQKRLHPGKKDQPPISWLKINIVKQEYPSRAKLQY